MPAFPGMGTGFLICCLGSSLPPQRWLYFLMVKRSVLCFIHGEHRHSNYHPNLKYQSFISERITEIILDLCFSLSFLNHYLSSQKEARQRAVFHQSKFDFLMSREVLKNLTDSKLDLQTNIYLLEEKKFHRKLFLFD